MKTLALCIAHPQAQEVLTRNSATWPIAGCDFFGVEHEDSPPMAWPESNPAFEGVVLRIGHGGNPYGALRPLLDRFMRVFKWCVTDGANLGYDAFCTSEADVIFTRPVPQCGMHPLGTLAGHKSDGFLGSDYFHPPWLVSLDDMRMIVEYSQRLLRVGLDERGFPDRFVGLLGDLFPDVAFRHSGNYSQNTLDQPHYLAEALTAIKRPEVWALHGVKTQAQYDALTK